jgi:protein-S-isoprenylcysteine O-methyltransferase Ste14
LGALRTATNWIIEAGSVALLGLIITSWLLSYRQPKAALVGSQGWFLTLPVWAQIGGGLAACALLVYLGCLLWIPIPLTVSPGLSAVLQIAGLAVFPVGWGLVLWSRWALGAMYGVSTSFEAQLQAQHRLVQRGPYAFVRHPMYLGYWLLILGALLAYRTWTSLALLTMCVPSFHRRAHREETALAKQFGEEWRAYAARTSFMIPFVW